MNWLLPGCEELALGKIPIEPGIELALGRIPIQPGIELADGALRHALADPLGRIVAVAPLVEGFL